ncbi:serine acetyltransferase [Oscillospiraceae bacterium HV4-5-C5C]|nr:serine acetyltransferase [Oscillospiraceae bacterium HV4-5-C5C]
MTQEQTDSPSAADRDTGGRSPEAANLVRQLQESYLRYPSLQDVNYGYLPDRKVIIDITHKLRALMFPGYYDRRDAAAYHTYFYLNDCLSEIRFKLRHEIGLALCHRRRQDADSISMCEASCPGEPDAAETIVDRFLERLPQVRDLLATDVEAAYDGDPAAGSFSEIILAYPGIFAITVHRLAHELYRLQVPLIPRIMSEYAHSKTGIDIHPGAEIGRYFFIDHGTGVVIGETSVIGEHCKIYQGVTLGALSTRGGQSLRGVRRHPTLGDHVTVYGGATILGGETVIGQGVTIGGNVFITRSVDAKTKVSVRGHNLKFQSPGTAAAPVISEPTTE